MANNAVEPGEIVLIGRDFMYEPLAQELLTTFGAQEISRDPSERREQLTQAGERVRIAVTTAMQGLQADEMDLLPNLKLIANFGVGYDATDVLAATERGITVTNTPDVLNDGVADLAVGLMIDVLRGVSAADQYARADRWPQASFPLQREVTGRRVGIVGLGRIGQAIADRLAGFRCEIAYHNRRPVPGSPLRYVDSLAELAQVSEVLIVVVPGGPQTRHLIDADVLDHLGPQGYLINVARGSVVDESALIMALAEGKIAGAGLDVYADEPNIPQALRESERTVLTPHIASGTYETRQAMADVVLGNVTDWLRNGTTRTPVNAE